MADISKEIQDFREAAYGEEVRGSMVSLAEKVNSEVEDNSAKVDTYGKSEAARAKAETDRVSAESSRVAVESRRATAETGRVSEETKRVNAEKARETAEGSRASAETARATAETSRVNVEKARVTAETARATAETSRVNVEKTRVTAETNRTTEETKRVNAEKARATAETARVNEFSSLKTESQTATTAANTAAQKAESYVLGDISDKTVTFTQASADTDIASGDKASTLFGKILKRFNILKTSITTITGNIGTLANLLTTDKGSLVAAINEIDRNSNTYIGSQFATDWLTISSNPGGKSIGLHAIGNLFSESGMGILKIRGQLINGASGNADYAAIYGGITLAKINSKFGTEFAGIYPELCSFRLSGTDGIDVIKLFEKGTCLWLSSSGIIVPARYYTESGTIGSWGLSNMRPGYIEMEIYLK